MEDSKIEGLKDFAFNLDVELNDLQLFLNFLIKKYKISDYDEKSCLEKIKYLKSFVTYLEDNILEEKVREKRYMSKEDFIKMLAMNEKDFRRFISNL